jgi:hypothetical protein
MSLGLNVHRPHRFTNLPGSTGVATIPRDNARMRNVLRSVPKQVPPTPPPSVERKPQEVSKKNMVADEIYSETQWVYATAAHPLVDSSTKEEVASAGEKVLLVYPMTSDESGKVTMRMKSVHPTTGQLRMHHVYVYDPDSDLRFVKDFTLVAQ